MAPPAGGSLGLCGSLPSTTARLYNMAAEGRKAGFFFFFNSVKDNPFKTLPRKTNKTFFLFLVRGVQGNLCP